jgi:hypothetical protein
MATPPKMWGVTGLNRPVIRLQDHWTTEATLVNHDKFTTLAPGEKQITERLTAYVEIYAAQQSPLQCGVGWLAFHMLFITPTWTLQNRAGAAPWPVWAIWLG